MNESDFCTYEFIISGDDKSEEVALRLNICNVSKAKQEKMIHEFESIKKRFKEIFSLDSAAINIGLLSLCTRARQRPVRKG